MTREQFTQTVLTLLRQSPFQPFVFELESGLQLLVDDPEMVACDGGGAGYLGDEEIHLLRYDQVRDVRLASKELAS